MRCSMCGKFNSRRICLPCLSKYLVQIRDEISKRREAGLMT